MTTPPIFISTDPAEISAAMILAFESATGKTLYPSQVERLQLDLAAYHESLVRIGIQSACEQNLVAFATGDRLAALGRLVGVERLAATKAVSAFQITLPSSVGYDSVFPVGWQATETYSGAWALTAEVIIPAGQVSRTAACECLTPGIKGNGIPAGSNFSPMLGNSTVLSTVISADGSAAETDEQLRARILQAPFGFSVAGPSGAYRFHALGAHPSITDVAVSNLGAGTVGVYLLTATGLPSQAVIDAVQAALSAENVRPLCDAVTVASPTRVPFAVEANVTTFSTADTAMVQSAVTAAAEAYVAGRKSGLGRDLVASQVLRALGVEGAYKVELIGWSDRVIVASEWADGTFLVHMVGSANG